MFRRVTAIVLVGLSVVAVITAPGSFAGYLPWLSVFQIVAPLFALAAIAHIGWLSRKATPHNIRSTWLFMAFVAIASLISSALLMYFNYQYATYPSYPAPSDVLLVLALLSLAAASRAAARASTPDVPTKFSYLPFAAGVLLLVAVWAPILFALVPLAEKIAAIVTLIIDITLFAGTWRLVRTLLPPDTATWTQPWAWLAIGAVCVLVGDISFAITSYLAVFNPILDLLWIFAFCCWTWSALIATPAHK